MVRVIIDFDEGTKAITSIETTGESPAEATLDRAGVSAGAGPLDADVSHLGDTSPEPREPNVEQETLSVGIPVAKNADDSAEMDGGSAPSD